MRIVYCINSLSQNGGLERVTVAKSSALAIIPGNHVWIITTKPGTYLFNLDNRVTLINLNINYYEGTSGYSRLRQLLVILSKQLEHRRKLKQLFKDISPDVIISTGGIEKFVLTSFRSPSCVLIREIHTPSNSRLFYANTPYERIIAKLGDFLDYHLFIKKYNQIVVLTNEDKDRCWRNNERVIVIPNPLCRAFPISSPLKNNTVISVGKLSKGKNYSSLINSWSLVHTRHPDWRLIILGEGEERLALESLIEELGLADNISLIGQVEDVGHFLVESSVFAFTSLSEGQGVSIMEAMSCGVPVVSFDCPCGPKDLIADGENGFLVPTGNIGVMADRICYLIENEDARIKMGYAAREVNHLYAQDVIIRKWIVLFNSLLQKRA